MEEHSVGAEEQAVSEPALVSLLLEKARAEHGYAHLVLYRAAEYFAAKKDYESATRLYECAVSFKPGFAMKLVKRSYDTMLRGLGKGLGCEEN